MVEIIPYTEDDDDRSNWIPLSTSPSPSSSGGGGRNRSSNVATMIPPPSHHNRATTTTTSAIDDDDDESRNRHHRHHHEDMVFVDRNVTIDDMDVDDDDDEWEELSPSYAASHRTSTSPPPPPPPPRPPTSTSSSATDVVDGMVMGSSPASSSPSWGMRRMLSRLAAATSSSSSSSSFSSSFTPPVDAPSTASGGVRNDDGGVDWRGADRSSNDDRGTDDGRTMPMGRVGRGGGGGGGGRSGCGRRSSPPGMEGGGEVHHPRRRRVDGGSKSSWAAPSTNVGGGGGDAESMLRRTLVRDPLLALPSSFLRHFLREVARRILPMSSSTHSSSRHNDDDDVVPHAATTMTTLVAIVASLGLSFVVTGCIGIATFVVRASANATASICARLLRFVVDAIARYEVRSTVVVVLACVSIARLRRRRGGRTIATMSDEDEGEDRRGVSYSISAILPWIVAIASPSSIEAVVILLSLLSFASVLVPGDDYATSAGGCLAAQVGIIVDDDDDDDNDYYGGRCRSYDVGSSHGAARSSHRNISFPAVATVALLVAAINALVVAMAATELDRRCRTRLGTSVVDDAEMSESSRNSYPGGISDGTSSAFSLAMSRLRKSRGCILRHVTECHAICILALAILSVSFVLVRALFAYFIRDGMNVIFAMGTASRHIVHVGLGIAMLVSLWNWSVAAVSENDALSFGRISRHALMKSVAEVSSNAVWSTDDAGSGLLGMLSNDDGVLRCAILEWIVDRWTASAIPSDSAPSEHAASRSGDESCPAEAMGVKEDGSKGEPTSNSSRNGNPPSPDPNSAFARAASNISTAAANDIAGDNQTSIPEYLSLHGVISKLDADETLIPTIERYRAWVYSIPPTRNAAMCVALWKMCPATSVFAVALLWYVGWSFVGGLCTCFLRCVRTPSQISIATNDGGCKMLCFVLTVLSPVILLEYHRVQIWWTGTANCVRSIECDIQSTDSRILRRDLTMNLMRADLGEFVSQPPVDTSFLLLRIWLLLIESISVLEASVPVVRCATVTYAAADFTANTMSLVDLAMEVKRRGLLCGVGMIAWDAFCYHLSNELEQRKKEADGDRAREEQSGDSEVLGGQYTSAAVRAVANFEKMSTNLSCLIKSDGGDDGHLRDKARKHEGIGSGGDDGHLHDELTKRVGVVPPNYNSSQDSGDTKEVSCHGESNPINPNSFKQEGDIVDDSGDHQNINSSLPFLIGGGIALASAVAGFAMHAANSKGKQTKKDPERDSR